MDRLEKGKGAPDVKLLTTDVWRMFQKIFEKSGFEVYDISAIDTGVLKRGNAERTEAFISTLEASLNPIIIQFK
ncbi:8714_t:CDS:2 [Rhizophagus irregularis]|nr:8714_t:CDS:2 [Rhizophagus irregularis]